MLSLLEYLSSLILLLLLLLRLFLRGGLCSSRTTISSSSSLSSSGTTRGGGGTRVGSTTTGFGTTTGGALDPLVRSLVRTSYVSVTRGPLWRDADAAVRRVRKLSTLCEAAVYSVRELETPSDGPKPRQEYMRKRTRRKPPTEPRTMPATMPGGGEELAEPYVDGIAAKEPESLVWRAWRVNVSCEKSLGRTGRRESVKGRAGGRLNVGGIVATVCRDNAVNCRMECGCLDRAVPEPHCVDEALIDRMQCLVGFSEKAVDGSRCQMVDRAPER